MPLPVPNLDDRDHADLVADALRRIPTLCPEWTDFSAGDPGVTLVELFAFLTDTLLYRLNRLPEKAFVSFLNLLGVQLEPPNAASVVLSFELDKDAGATVTVPRGTQVLVGRERAGGEELVFTTVREVTVAPAGTAEVEAVNAELVEAERVPAGTGLPGHTVRVARPPIVRSAAGGLDLVVAVAATPEELAGRVAAVEHDGRPYRVWHEVQAFGSDADDPHAYVADRVEGVVTFAPAVRRATAEGLEAVAAALGAVPAEGADIRVSYGRGGGSAGNVAAHTLTELRHPVPGLSVTNPRAATGGRDTETLANALVRGPQELHSLERAVTARDFELAALRSSGAVSRARALTRADLWSYATPGTVEVLLVPAPPSADAAAAISAEALEALQTPDALRAVQLDLDSRRPMGIRCEVSWTRYKTVRVAARVVVHRAEDRAAAAARMIDRLRRTINPVPTGDLPGWRFGEALRASNVYDALLAERGVRYVEQVRLLVNEVPEDVRSIAKDPLQPHTWYCASGSILFRSLDDGDGWEPSGRFGGETVEVVRTTAERPGLVVTLSRVGTAEHSRLRVSLDCGETWEAAADLDFHVEDVALLRRDDSLLALLATDRGLYELPLRRGAVPVQVLVDAAHQDLGFYAVEVVESDQGDLNVAVAAQEEGGVFLSGAGGRSGTFRPLGSFAGSKDIRVLAVRREGPARYLLAGVTVGGTDAGEGVHMVEIVGTEVSPQGWQPLSAGWAAGSCHAVAMHGRTILAASHSRGILRLDLGTPEPSWRAASVESGLALRDPGRFAPLTAVVSDAAGIVMAGGPVIDEVRTGIRRSDDGAVTFQSVGEHEFTERVTLPPTWLFCSGEHEIEVVSDDAAL
jgi:hypothetical protein